MSTNKTNNKTINKTNNKTKDISTDKKTYIISAPIVIKSFVTKRGEATGHKEMYIQRSIQDYYIKFCESNISQEDLENHLASIDNEIKVVTLEVEFLDGEWDTCEPTPEQQQSRIGEYVIIHRIIKN
jgi:hypothetical protein